MNTLALTPWAFLTLGLVTSLHCVFMCGGLVLTYAVKGGAEGSWPQRLIPHLVYQGAKIASYAAVAIVLGALVALVGRAVNVTGVRNWVMVAAGVYMLLLGLSMTGRFRVLRYLTPKPPAFLVSALSRGRHKAVSDVAEGASSLTTPLMFGLLTGLMPCAPLIAAQSAAMSSGSPLLGVGLMGAFGIGTAPLMLVFGFASSLLSKGFRKRMQIVAALAVVLFSLVILDRGLTLVGSPVTFDSVRTSLAGGPAGGGGYSTAADGVAEVPLVIRGTTFVPDIVNVPADRRVRLVVDRQEDVACSAQIAIPQLRVLQDLAPNAVTKVELAATKAGTYRLTCGMGMMSGRIVFDAAGGGGGGGGTALPAVAVAAVVALLAGVYLVIRRRRATG